MAQNTCSPQSIYGGWRQTLFLGLTVRDFSAQGGLGQQASSLTVNLVYDNCSGTREYLDEQFNWTSGEFDGDPGYNDAPVGSAAIFKIAETRTGEFDVVDDGFEFAGIIQSLNFNRDGNGQKVRTVTLTSPTLLLDGTQVIIDGYTAELPNRFIFPDEYTNNVINVYGYLESLGGNCSDYFDPATGAGLGSPAGGFGTSQRSERGVPWVWIKNAMQVLLGGLYNGDGDKAFANFPGVARLIKGVGTYGSVYSNEYIVDIADLPGSNDLGSDLSVNPGRGVLEPIEEPETALDSLQYRLNGPIMTVSDIINQVTQDAGYDYFVDLYPTKNDGFESGVVNVVKVKAIPRFNFYPDDVLNDINEFISGNADYISTDSVGKELILDNTEALLIGAQRQDMFQVYPEDTGIQGAYSRIQPFFGYQPGTPPTIDGSGVVEREPIEVLWGQDPGLIFADQFVQCNRGATQDFLQQWFFRLDYNRLPLNFEYNIQVGIYNGDPETLLCAALGDFESWLNWLFKYGGPPENRPIDTCRLYGMIIDKADSLDPEGNSFFDFARKKGSSGYWWSKIIAESKSAFDRTTLTYNSDVLPAETTSPDSYSWLFQDLATIYKFLNNVAETYYGKQFLVEVPFACRYLDPVTKKFNYSDVPSADGGYIDICTNEKGQQIPSPGNAADDPDIDFENGDDCFIGVTGVIGLKHPLETDIFSDDVGKLPAILKFDPYLGYGKYHDEFQQWLYERNENGDIKYPTRKIQHKVPPNFIGADFPQDEFYTLGGGFDTNLEFDPFQPVYAKCEVEESWLVINKPIYITGSEDQEEKRCEYFPGDDTRPSYEDGGGITLNAILKLPEGVFLKAGVRENPDPFGIKPFPLRDRYQYGAPYYGNTNAIACTSFGNNFRLAQFWNDFQLNGGDNTSPPLFRDPTDMKRHNISVGDEIGMGSFPFAFPCNAILPIKSNTRTYGPFYRYSSKDLDTSPESVEQIIKGLPGKTYTEKDEGIAPWEYGGTIYMNEGANAKLSGIVRAQQESERGSITIAGYPNLQMGGALNEKPYYITNRYGLGTPRKLNVKGYASPAGLKTFLQLDTIPATTGNKSQITDISTQVSPTNVTTSYTLSTFTPVNGRFSRDNADRLKQQAQERYKRDREIRASKRQTANEELSLAKKRYKNLGLEVNTTSFVERSPAAAIAGLYQTKNASPTGNLNPPGQINTVINNVSGVARKEVLTQTVNQLSNLQAYDNAGVISMDGFFRPVRTRAALNSGLGPQLSVENDAADILGDAYQTVPYRSGPYKKQVRQSETPPGPLNDWTGLIINTTYLDFLVGPYTDLSARSINSGVGHDIELVARSSAKVMGKKNAGNLSVLNSGNEIQYSDTYRYMAHRGPLVVAGWGYDLYGKPIPNANETGLFSGIPGQAQLPQNQWTSGNAYNGLHRQDYNLLTDEFHSGFLSDPETWPVGPVDLRWDRKRSVWTVPNDFRIYVANLQEALSGLGNSVTAAVYNADDVYDESGSRPLDWEIEVTMPLPDVAIDAEPILVYYSHESGQWWPISYCCSSEGGGGGGTPPGGGDDDIPCDRCTGNCYWRWDGSKWNKMGSDNCDPNNDCFCQPPNYDGIPGTPSDLMISTNCAQVGCFGGGGGVQNLAGGSNDPIVYAASESNSVTAAKVYGSVLVDMPYNQSFTYGSGINPKYTSYTGLLVDITGTGHVSAFITDCIGTGNNTECFNRDVFNSGGFETFCVANVDNSYALPAGTKISVQFDAGLQCYRIIRYTLPNNGCQEVTASTGLYYYSRVMADASAGQVILDLPLSTATGIAGSEFYIKKIDASINAVIVSGTGSDLIDGQSTYTINNQYEAVKIVNCGANTWYVL